MTWCSDQKTGQDDDQSRETSSVDPSSPSKTKEQPAAIANAKSSHQLHHHQPPNIPVRTCPSCGHEINLIKDQGGGINELPGLPAGVKFDPMDQELLEHLEGKVRSDQRNLHRLIDEFIPTLEGENGICYTHPEKLPGVSKNGQIRHFFHRPSKAYTTGNRKRRKVHTDNDDQAGGETRWHKTGKTRPVFGKGELKGFKKILVLYTNYGKQRKPEKTNWVMHQYHLGDNEEEKDGELVVSKVFYQTQPRQCGNNNHNNHNNINSNLGVGKGSSMGVGSKMNGTVTPEGSHCLKNQAVVEYFNSPFISFDQGTQNRGNSQQMLPHFAVHDGSSLVPN
ncbi:hypothetical protein CDL15_Pgr002848 [Punica granatum]|uniref:NAC domain-containing protein n=1 Tax=Punica granatum TaxID=22663 RepID=A0A218X0Z4_PUNGR|nr:hypothetical protein CDL15_Pgr002848 [Punica granatum]PKI42732.1 hypothetical protein CRG98_036860 [Punica granatum]